MFKKNEKKVQKNERNHLKKLGEAFLVPFGF